MTSQKSILIVGCSTHGISSMLAQELAKRNHLVFIAVPDPRKVPQLTLTLPTVKVITLDPKTPASVAEGVRAVASATEQEHGGRGLDVLINDAGLSQPLALLDVVMDAAKDVYDAKVTETLSIAGAFADVLARKQGRILNLSSSGAFIAAPCMNKSTHFSAKGALTRLSEQMRYEMAPWGVGVTSVMLQTMPSATDSEPRVLFPDRSPCASVKELVTRWAGGSSKPESGTLASLVDLVLEENMNNGPSSTWQWMKAYLWSTETDDMSRIEQGITRAVSA